MNKTLELSRVRDALALDLTADREPYPETAPLNINPWLAMSLMQKAIRRNRRDLALSAARTLYDCSPERLWRRLSVTAFEDIGAADIDVVSRVLAGLKGKMWRNKFGGEWKVARHLVLMMCDAPKCRGADDLIMIWLLWKDDVDEVLATSFLSECEFVHSSVFAVKFEGCRLYRWRDAQLKLAQVHVFDERSESDNARLYCWQNITALWRIAMQEKLQTDEGKNKYKKRKSTVEPVFGIIKSVLGFTHFHLRGIENVKNEWTLMALAHNCKRLSKLTAQ